MIYLSIFLVFSSPVCMKKETVWWLKDSNFLGMRICVTPTERVPGPVEELAENEGNLQWVLEKENSMDQNWL